METGTLDLEGRSLTSLAPGLFQDARALSAVTRAKLSGNKLQVGVGGVGGCFRYVWHFSVCCDLCFARKLTICLAEGSQVLPAGGFVVRGVMVSSYIWYVS